MERLASESGGGSGYSSGRLMQALAFALVLHALVLLPGAFFGSTKASSKDAAKPPASADAARTDAKPEDTKKIETPAPAAPVTVKPPAKPKNSIEADLMNVPPKTTPDNNTGAPAPKSTGANAKNGNGIPSLPSPGGLDDNSFK